jgi:hypothetical protein
MQRQENDSWWLGVGVSVFVAFVIGLMTIGGMLALALVSRCGF